MSDNEYLQSAYNEDDFGFDKEADAIDNYETTYVHECINKFTEEAFDSDFYDFNQSDVEGFIDGIYKYPINQQFLQAMKVNLVVTSRIFLSPQLRDITK